MDLLLLAKSAFILLILFFLFYTLLDGFDLGIGMSMPFLPQRTRALDAIVPFWDGNEVWIIMAVGFLFAAFPPLYAALLPVFYLPLFLVLFAFIARAISIEVLYHTPPKADLWWWLLTGSSTLIPLGGALLVAFVAGGISVDGSGIALQTTITTGIIAWLFAIGSVGTLLWYGGVFLCIRGILPAMPVQNRVAGVIATAFAAAIAVLLYGMAASGTASYLSIIGAVVTIAGMTVSLISQSVKVKFVAAGASIAGWWGIVAVLLYEKIFGISILTDAITAPVSTLKIIVPLAAVMMLLILLYTRFIYGIFNKKLSNSQKGV